MIPGSEIIYLVCQDTCPSPLHLSISILVSDFVIYPAAEAKNIGVILHCPFSRHTYQISHQVLSNPTSKVPYVPNPPFIPSFLAESQPHHLLDGQIYLLLHLDGRVQMPLHMFYSCPL